MGRFGMTVRGMVWLALSDDRRVCCCGLCGGFWVFLSGFGQADARRHPVRATARARISQFAEANSMCRWLRFLAIPR